MDPVVHFELPATDLERMQRFYQSCFGWQAFAPPGMRYVFVSTTPADPKTMAPVKPGAINGGMTLRQGPIQAPVLVVKVADLDKALAAVEKAGGKMVHGKTDVGPGISAYVQDTEGNTISLFQDKPAG
jgi:predicted enzyme related to lactoylglutathione lyase